MSRSPRGYVADMRIFQQQTLTKMQNSATVFSTFVTVVASWHVSKLGFTTSMFHTRIFRNVVFIYPYVNANNILGGTM